MRIYLFKSESRRELRAFSDESSGAKLPVRFRPWRAFGVIGPDKDPPHGLSRDKIEAAIREIGFQLWRMTPKAKGEGEE
jgi:hypothetical protein